MSEADLFRHYSREAARSSSQATSENEKRVLMGLACTWAQAALMSERVLGSSFIPSPRNPHDGASVAGTSARLAPKDALQQVVERGVDLLHEPVKAFAANEFDLTWLMR